MHRRTLISLASLAFLAAAPRVAAQQALPALGTSAAGASLNMVANAIRVTSQAPQLDGRLDDAAWTAAPVLSGFVQREPNEGQPATQRTEVRVTYTDDAVYVGVRAFDSDPAGIRAQLTRRDQGSPSDWVGVMLDSYHDRRTAFAFWVNAAGVKRDVYLFNDTDGDDSWDAVWDAAVSRDAEGWTAEFRIPFSQLRFARGQAQTFGFNVAREIPRLNEITYWRLIPRNASGYVSLFGELQGFEGLRPPRRLEVLPYSVARAERSRPDAANPFNDGRTASASAGADIKYGLTSNITLDVALNPDFGQVEQDPAFVNLSAFEQFQPERRPFFTEGVNIFRFPILLGDGDGANEQLFYSRRVGRNPQGFADPRGGYAEQIPSTTILGAAKLSGRMPSGWTVGLLAATTSEEEARVRDSGGQSHQDIVEPGSTYLVGRLARDLRQGRTVVGVFGTALRRDLPASGELDWLRTSAYSGAVDFNHRFAGDRMRLRGWVAGSHIRGSTDAILAAQQSSARYFQRPDNDYREVDPSRTSMTGVASQLTLANEAGNTRWSFGYDARSPDFEVNDMGFQRTADYVQQFGWLQQRWTNPGRVFRRFFVNLNQWQNWDWGGERFNLGGNVNANWQFANYMGGYAGMALDLEGFNRTELRGGPMIRRPRSHNGWWGMYSDFRKPVSVELGGWFFGQADNDSRASGINAWIQLRPSAAAEVSFGPSYSFSHDDWLYQTTTTLNSGTQYVLSETDFNTFSASFRVNLTFAPNLTLQAFVSPFYSTVRRAAFKQLADPRAERYADRFTAVGAQRDPVTNEVTLDVDGDATHETSIGNPDFAYTSLRSNFVLRWEYRPGSTVFVVWQQGREAQGPDGRFRMGDIGSSIVDARPANVFLVKFNYWLSL